MRPSELLTYTGWCTHMEDIHTTTHAIIRQRIKRHCGKNIACEFLGVCCGLFAIFVLVQVMCVLPPASVSVTVSVCV